MKTLKPLGDRVLLKVNLETKKSKEGTEYTDLSREAKVIETNSPLIKKGSVVYYNPRGCIQIETQSTKKYVVLIIDSCDVYGILS